MKSSLIYVIVFILLSTNAICQNKHIIPIKETRNITVVSVVVGNMTIPNILLDTGFSFDGLLIYNPDYKDSLDLSNTIEVRIGGAGDGEGSTALMIDSGEFYLGNISMTNQRILILQGDIYKDVPTNGIIGHSIFGNYVTHIDYDKEIMILYDNNNITIDSSWTMLPVFFKDNSIPWIEASVVIEDEEPIPLSIYIDLAARDAIVLLEKPDMKFSLPMETENIHLGIGLSGDIYGKTGSISELILGPYKLQNVTASFADAKTRSKQVGADAILGNNSLRRFNIIFDYSNKKLYLKPNSFFNEPFN